MHHNTNQESQNMSHDIEAVFLAVVSEGVLFAKYNQSAIESPSQQFPVMLGMNRWCGDFGFIGGKREQGESLQDAVVREAKEEAGLTLTDDDVSRLTKVCCHEFYWGNKLVRSHLFCLPVEFQRIGEILANNHNAENYIAEGHLTSVHLADYGNGNGFPTFIRNQMATSVVEEIAALAQHLGWDVKYGMKVPQRLIDTSVKVISE